MLRYRHRILVILVLVLVLVVLLRHDAGPSRLSSAPLISSTTLRLLLPANHAAGCSSRHSPGRQPLLPGRQAGHSARVDEHPGCNGWYLCGQQYLALLISVMLQPPHGLVRRPTARAGLPRAPSAQVKSGGLDATTAWFRCQHHSEEELWEAMRPGHSEIEVEVCQNHVYCHIYNGFLSSRHAIVSNA